MFFHLLIDVVGKTLFKCMDALVQVIFSYIGRVTANCINSLPDKLIQQIRNLIVINIVEVDKRCYQLLDGRHPGTAGSTGDNLEFRGIMQALADYFTSQFFEIITGRCIKIKVLEYSLYILLLNDNPRNLDNIVPVVLDYNIYYLINLGNLFGSLLFGEKAAFNAFLYCSNSFLAKFLLYAIILKVAKRYHTFGCNIGNGRFDSFTDLGDILLGFLAYFTLDLFKLFTNLLLCRSGGVFHTTTSIPIVVLVQFYERNPFEKRITFISLVDNLLEIVVCNNS